MKLSTDTIRWQTYSIIKDLTQSTIRAEGVSLPRGANKDRDPQLLDPQPIHIHRDDHSLQKIYTNKHDVGVSVEEPEGGVRSRNSCISPLKTSAPSGFTFIEINEFEAKL